MTNTNRNGKQFTGEEPDLETAEAEVVDADAADESLADGDEMIDIDRIVAERDSYLDQLQRSVAEFANYRRRNEQERAQLAEIVRKDVLALFLPVIDDFERALALIPDDEKSKGWVTGLQMIDTKFRGILERSNAEIIDPVGEPFDPSRHEAVATEPGSTGSTVVEVYQKGYAIGDLLVRPAMVKTGDPEKVDA